MKAKPVESLRQKKGNFYVVRQLSTKPFIDDKWVGNERDKLKKYLVVKYPKSYDAFIPVWNEYKGKKVIWWDKTPHETIKSSIKNYQNLKDRKEKNDCKIKEARILFAKKITRFHCDSFQEAESKYMAWCLDDGMKVSKLQLGKNSGDD